MRLTTIETTNQVEFLEKSTAYFTEIVTTLALSKSQIHLAFPGGSSVIEFYKQLAVTDLPWTKMHFWVSDERYVTMDHPDSNFGQLLKNISPDKVINEDNLHPVNTFLEISEAAQSYENEIIKANAGSFDCIIFGMGEDGHIGSLFPGHDDEINSQNLVISINNSPKPPPQRISLTLKCASQSKNIILLAKGESKKTLINQALSKSAQNAQLPVEKLLQLDTNITIITQ